MLPTRKSNLSINRSYKEHGIGIEVGEPYLTYCKTFKYYRSVTDNSYNPQHLYIISDDKIKEGDWCLSKLNEIVVFKGKNFNYKKIIATTDASLDLPQPSQQFIEKYIKSYNKGVILSDVFVESNESHDSLDFRDIYIPQSLKVNPKDNIITIKTVEDSYSREELETELRKAFRAGEDFGSSPFNQNKKLLNEDEYIKENL